MRWGGAELGKPAVLSFPAALPRFIQNFGSPFKGLGNLYFGLIRKSNTSDPHSLLRISRFFVMPPSLDQFIAECMANPTPAMQEISERMETAARREGANTVGALGMLSIPPVPPDDYLKLYAKALYIIRHALPEDPANEELQEIVESAFYSLNMQRVLLAGEPHTLTPSFITELWIPIIRSLPSQASTVPGAAMLATGWGFLPEEAMVSAMQVLSDILPMPWLTTMNRRGLWACLLHATVGVGPATLKDPRGRAKLVRRLQSCGLVKPIVRLTAQPLLESLPARVHADTDTIRNEYLMLLTLAVAIAVSSAEENPEAASLLAETESAVVANSPWVWTGLKRLGTTWAQARGPQTLVCAPYAFIMLASSGPRAYKAATDAGGEALLRSLIDHLWETWPQKAPPPYFKEVLLGEFQGASGRSEEFNGWAVSFAVPLLCSQLVIAEVAGNEGCAEDIKEQMGLDLDEISAMIGANSYRGESLEADRWANQDVTVETTICTGCGRRREMAKRCSNCRVARFCSEKCLRKNWNVHRPACMAAQAAEAP